jgi:hypothetical protein
MDAGIGGRGDLGVAGVDAKILNDRLQDYGWNENNENPDLSQ